MDKQKQIEEMVEELTKDMGIAFQLSGTTRFAPVAEMLVECGYRKIPKGAVVLTEEEYESLKIEKDFDYGYREGESNMTSYYENIRLPEVRKETAEKFASMLKELVADRNCNDDYDWEDVQVDGQIFVECVDEICKELTEGKV